MATQGTILWSELMTNEVQKAKDFYGKSLGVTFEQMPSPGPEYWLAMIDGKPAWGIIDMTRKPGGPSGWFTYMSVDDVDSLVAQAEASGAKLCTPIFDIPTVGRIAVLEDPTGAIIGWMKPEMNE
ncbi:VOC family protein [Aestuariivirga sp.]|uniref:VOC family protein n=1 Tax=Aestuariivirga sp. TaxID=2650926 RepID=UPI003BA956E4